MTLPPYAIIFGNGASGTKRLLKTFDQDPRTHCRNEPYLNVGSDFAQLRSIPRGWTLRPDEEAVLENGWDEAVRFSMVANGDNDLWPVPPKLHHRRLARPLGALRVLESIRARRLLGKVLPGLGRTEWRAPGWAVDHEALARSFLVMKFNQSPAFGAWLLANRPEVRAIHIVRHPAGCLSSWTKRHLADTDVEEVRRACTQRIRHITDLDDEWGQRFREIGRGEPEDLTVEEAELLFWLYANLIVYAAGQGRDDRYRRVLDEEVVLDPERTLRDLLEFCGLEWGEEVRTHVARHASSWEAAAVPWRELVPRESWELVERFLSVPELQGWWEGDQRVSGIAYSWK